MILNEKISPCKIRVYVTGGTFDKEYDELNGKLFFKESHIHEMLKLGRSRVTTEVQTLLMKDSLEITETDRDLILRACKSCAENKIVITHGTDTMEQTAQKLGNALSELPGKTIVLTGAMVPYAFGSSDGLFNLGAALAFVQAAPEGVYIAMNGKLFDWQSATKNKKTGEFVVS